MDTWTFIKKYLIEPLGWMSTVTLVVLLTLSYLDLLRTINVINFYALSTFALPIFTFSLNELFKRFSLKWQSRLRVLCLAIFSSSIILLFYVYLSTQKWKIITNLNLYDFPTLSIWISVFCLYISSYVLVSMSVSSSNEIKKNDLELANDKTLSSFITYTITLIGVFLVAIAIRITQLADLSLWTDESTTVLAAKQIIDGNGQYFLSGEFYDRAVIYHHYLAWFLTEFHALGVYTASRLANTPFFFISFVGIFFLGKYLHNRRAGLIAAILYSFSWISVSMFREARFYEMFSALFICFTFLIIYGEDMIYNFYLRYRKVLPKHHSENPFLRLKFYSSLIALGAIGYLSFDTQQFVVFLLYSVVLYGFLIFIFRKDKVGLGIFILGTLTVIASALIAFGKDFKFIYLYKYPQPEWKSLIPDLPYSEFWHFLMLNQYSYLIGAAAIVIPLLILKFNRKSIFALSIAIGWYSIIGLQGYGADVIRYFYPALPFAVLIIGISIDTYLKVLKNILPRFILGTVTILLIITTLYGGYTEGSSAIDRNSKNPLKNSNFDSAIDYLISTGAFGSATMLTDNTFSMTYYLTLEHSPDFVVINSDIVQFDEGKTELYTAAPEIDYREIVDVPKPAYFVFSYINSRMGDDFLPFLKTIGTEVYMERSRRIYYFPDLSTSTPSSPAKFFFKYE